MNLVINFLFFNKQISVSFFEQSTKEHTSKMLRRSKTTLSSVAVVNVAAITIVIQNYFTTRQIGSYLFNDKIEYFSGIGISYAFF